MFEPMPALIRRERERQGQSQDGLAKLAGVSRSSIVALEKGEDNVSLDILLKVANTLRMTEVRIAALNLAPAQPDLTVLLAAEEAIATARRVVAQATAINTELDRVAGTISAQLDRVLTPVPDVGIAKVVERMTAGAAHDRSTGAALRELAESDSTRARAARRPQAAKRNTRKRER